MLDQKNDEKKQLKQLIEPVEKICDIQPNSLLNSNIQDLHLKQSSSFEPQMLKKETHEDLFVPNSLIAQTFNQNFMPAKQGPLLQNVDPLKEKLKLNEGLLGKVNRREMRKLYRKNPDGHLKERYKIKSLIFIF